METKNEKKVDENLMSRVFGAIGEETVKKLLDLKVLIIGMRGLGVETAKNTILNNVGVVDIYDNDKVIINDLGSNFYLTKNDIGKRRDEAVISKLIELNNNVRVSVVSVDEKNDNILNHFEKYSVVILTEMKPTFVVTQMDKICREKKVKFLYAACLGLAGFVFTDFGEHTILDKTGNSPKKFYIKKITKDENGIVDLLPVEGKGDLGGEGYITFKDVGGMIELNDGEKRKYELEKFCQIRIGDTSKYSDYTEGGIVTEVKIPEKINYGSFEERTLMPNSTGEFSIYDAAKPGRTEFLNLCLLCLGNYLVCTNGKLPELGDKTNLPLYIQCVKNFYEQSKTAPTYKNIQKFDEKIVEDLFIYSKAEISPMCSFFGGVLSHEIIKATGKFTPINQWFILDFFETISLIKDADRKLEGTRYDDQIAIYGKEIQKKLNDLNIFMIGAGATGCELLKNFAMMGISTNKEKKVVVTDNDNIEISNLSRQFLFRRKDVNKSKSEVAKSAVNVMNPELNVEALQLKVSKDPDDYFNEKFWDSQNFVFMAVDNIKARKDIDLNVVKYRNIEVDVGTLGARGLCQLVIPFKTETYNDKNHESNEQSIPQCTLRHFPSNYNHCIEWSRSKFDDYFTVIVKDVREFFENYDEFSNNINLNGGSAIEKLEKIKKVKELVEIIVNKDYDSLVKLIIDRYTENYDNNIQQLLHNCPPDYIDERGVKFWGGQRRIPHPIKFDVNDKNCIEYVRSYLYIMNNALNLRFENDKLSEKEIKASASKYKIPEFSPQKMKIQMDDRPNEQNENQNNNATNEENNEDDINNNEIELNEKQFKDILTDIKKYSNGAVNFSSISPQEFEKDHDENGHIDFIFISSVIRANNYKIDSTDRNQTKLKAGNIIPAISTTTAATIGLACMEMYMMVQTNDITILKNGYINLNQSDFLLSEPNEAIKMKDVKYDENLFSAVKTIPTGFTTWDIIDLKASLTVQQLMDYIKKTYDVNVEMIVVEDAMIYDSDLHRKKKEKLQQTIEELYFNKTQSKKEGKIYLFFNITGSINNVTIEGEKIEKASVSMPKFRYKL